VSAAKPEAKDRRRRRWRTIARLAAVAGILLVAVSIAAWVWIESNAGQQRVRGWLERRGSEALGRRLDIASLQLDLLPLRVTLAGITVAGDAGADQPLLRVERLDARLDPWALWRRRISVESLEVSSPIFHWDSGTPLLPRAGTEDRGLGFSVEIHQLSVRDGAVEIDHERWDLDTALTGVGFELLADAARGADPAIFGGSIAIGGGNVRLRRFTEPGEPAGELLVRNAELSYRSDGDVVRIDGARIGIGDSLVVASGRVTGWRSVSLEVTADVDVDDVVALIGLPQSPAHAGALQLTGTLVFGEPPLAFSGTVAADSLLIAGLEASGVTASVEATRQRLVVEDIEATAFGGAVQARLEGDLQADPRVWRVEYGARSVDLARLTESGAVPGFRFVGIGDLAGELTWSSPWRQTIAGSGLFDLQLPPGTLAGLPASPGPPAGAFDVGTEAQPPAPTPPGPVPEARPAPSLPLPLEAAGLYDIEDGAIFLRSATVSLPRNRATIEGSIGAAGELALAVSIDSSDLRMLDRFFNQLRRFRGEQPVPQPLGITGGGRARVTIGGSISDPTVVGTASATGLSVANVSIGDLDGSLRLAGSALAIDNLRVRRGAGGAEGSARLRIGERLGPGPDYALDLRLQRYPVAARLTRLGAPLDAAGEASGEISLAGDYGAAPAGTITLHAEDIALNELSGLTADIRMRVDGDRWLAEELSLQGPRGQLIASGTWRRSTDAIEARIDATAVDAAIIGELLGRELGMGGALELTAQIDGVLSAPDGAAVLRWTRAEAFGVQGGSVAASAELRGGSLAVAAIGRPDPTVAAVPPPTPIAGGQPIPLPDFPASGWAATLSAELGGARPATLRAAGESSLILAALVAQGYRPGDDLEVEGAVELEGSGPLDDWQRWSGSATLTGFSLAQAGLAFEVPDPVALQLDNGILSAELPRLVTGAGNLQARVVVDLIHGTWLEGSASGSLALDLLRVFSDELDVGGNIDVSVEATGDVAGTDLAGLFNLHNVFLAGEASPWSVESIDGEVELVGGQLRLSGVSGIVAGRPFRADGLIPLAALTGDETGAPAHLELEVEDLPLTPLWQRAGALGAVLTGGATSVTVSLDGRGADWRSWRGSIDVRSLDVRLADDLSLQMAQPTSIAVGGGNLTLVEPIVMRGPGTDLQIGGTFLLDPFRLDTTITGTANLDPLNALTGNFGLAGRATVDLRISGDPPDLDYDGTVEVVSGLFSTPIMQPIDGIQATLTLQGRLIRIDRFLGTLGSAGTRSTSNVNITGEIQLREPTTHRFLLNVGIDSAQLRLQPGIRMNASADLVHEGTLERSILSGTLSVSEAQYTVRWESEADMVALTDSGASRVDHELARTVNLDLEVTAPTGVRILNNMADIELGADLQVRGTLAEPVLLGGATVLDGDITLLDHRYRFVRGSVEFQNPVRTEPSVDVLLETSIRQYLVTVAVSGSPARGDLQVTPTSSPPLSDLELIQLLTVGDAPDRTRTASDDTVTLGAVGAQATSFLTRQYLGQVERGAQRVFGVDRFRVDPAVVEGSGDPTARVTIGKQVTPDLLVTWTSVLGTSDEQLVTVEYQLTRGIRITATREEDGSLAVDFRIDHRFR
jgi:autotransporter translocation and assembly factor TamB